MEADNFIEKAMLILSLKIKPPDLLFVVFLVVSFAIFEDTISYFPSIFARMKDGISPSVPPPQKKLITLPVSFTE